MEDGIHTVSPLWDGRIPKPPASFNDQTVFRLFALGDKERSSWSLRAASTTNEEPKELEIHKLNTGAISKQLRRLHVPESMHLRAHFTLSTHL